MRSATTQLVTHLLYDGHGGWIEAKRVWVEHPHPEVDGATNGWGWEFKSPHDAARWLRA